ncbi:hypothetical protein [Calothrix sp. NIES-2098]
MGDRSFLWRYCKVREIYKRNASSGLNAKIKPTRVMIEWSKGDVG